MSDAPMGIATWPGVQQVLSASMTMCQGVSPSVCTLEIAPQPNDVALEGDLTFQYGDDPPIVFPRCRVDQASFSYSRSGLLWRLSIWDRRWRWRFGWIAGTANERHGDVPAAGSPALRPNAGVPPIVIPTIDSWSTETPRQMAGQLLKAMHETRYDVSQMPDNWYPEAYWSHDNPANLLAQLAESLGCRVVLGVDDVVRVVRVGVGRDLPQGAVMQVSDVVAPAVVPEKIVFFGGKTRFQVDLLLEAVGEDVDGTIKPIDELSYKPANGGWNTADAINPHGFNFLGIPGADPIDQPLTPILIFNEQHKGVVNPRQLARKTVYHYYRIKMQDMADYVAKRPGKGLVVPGRSGDPIKYLWQILPIEDVQVNGYYDAERIFRPYDAWVWGQWFDVTDTTSGGGGAGPLITAQSGNVTPGKRYYHPFTIDKEHGIVVFAELCYLGGAGNLPLPAQMGLRCAVNVQSADEHAAFDHYFLERSIPHGSKGSGSLVVKRDEVVRAVIPDYADDHTIRGKDENIADCDKQANYAIDAVLIALQKRDSADATYIGLLPVSPDGAIWQVTWSVGAGGATTRIARNTEWDPKVPSYVERRSYEKDSWNDKLVQQIVAQGRRERGG